MHKKLQKFTGLSLRGLIFLSIFFLAACTTKRDDSLVECFLRRFLFEEGGAYTLVGDKPMTDMLVFTGSSKDIALGTISPKALENLEYVDDHTLEQWSAWKTFIEGHAFEDFLFVERRCPTDPTYLWVALINVPQTVKIIQSHEALFQQILGSRHLDAANLIKELTDPKSRFLEAIFSDHYLSGLLHGYGEENSRIFAEACQDEAARCMLKLPSEKIEGPITHEHFPLPTYAACADDRMSLRYQTQRNDIRGVYRKGDIINTTLECLRKRVS